MIQELKLLILFLLIFLNGYRIVCRPVFSGLLPGNKKGKMLHELGKVAVARDHFRLAAEERGIYCISFLGVVHQCLVMENHDPVLHNLKL